MVETSVAVATPSTTAVRIRKGSASAGSATRKVRPISRLAARGTRPTLLTAVAPPDHKAKQDGQHNCWQQPACEKRCDRYAGYRPYRDENEAGRDGFRLRSRRGQQRDQIARLGAALLHLRKQHRRDSRHVGRFRAGNPGDQIHPGDKNVVQAAGHVPQHACEERDHGTCHPGHLDQQAEKDEERHREQDEVAHPLVHASDENHQRRLRGQRKIAEDRKPECKRDRHACEDGRGDDAHEKDQQVEVAELPEHGCPEPEQDDETGDGAERKSEQLRRAYLCKPQQCKDRHQCGPDRQGRGPPGIRDLQRRRGDENLLPRIFVGRSSDQKQEGERSPGRECFKQPARRGASMPTAAVMRMCSSRRNAMTAPSIASHRNTMAASSSDQVNGRSKTYRAITPASRTTISTATSAAARSSTQAPSSESMAPLTDPRSASSRALSGTGA